MNVLSLFAGVGGFDLGLERAGFRIVGQCEADPAARRILEKHWPDVPCHPDVSTLDEEWFGENRIEPVDLVCGGFPCQDLSVAGKRAGLGGSRSGLFHDACRVADLVLGDDGYLLLENVPGLLSSNDGRDFAVILATLADLGFQNVAWRVLDSRFFGIPQRRRRVFILAGRSRTVSAESVLFEPEGGGGDSPAVENAGEETPLGSGCGVTGDGGGVTHSLTLAETAPTLDASFARLHGHDNQHIDAGAGLFVPEQVGALTAKGPGTMGAPEVDADQMISPEARVRRLTPIECERLQGFPDGWTIPGDEPWQDHPAPDGPRYKQMGNAVTVPVIEWLGRRLIARAGG